MSPAILVTGGAGFIGSHTCKELAEQGFLPVAIDDLSTGHREAVRWGPLVQARVHDGDAVRKALTEYRPKAVIHFAASAYVGESTERPDKYYDNNVVGSLALFDTCRAAGVDAIVFSSSCATYGSPASLPVTEETPQSPISPYGRS